MLRKRKISFSTLLSAVSPQRCSVAKISQIHVIRGVDDMRMSLVEDDDGRRSVCIEHGEDGEDNL